MIDLTEINYVRAEEVDQCFANFNEKGEFKTVRVLSKNHPGMLFLMDLAEESHTELDFHMFKHDLKEVLDGIKQSKLTLEDVAQELERLLEPSLSNGEFEPCGHLNHDSAHKIFAEMGAKQESQLGKEWMAERAINLSDKAEPHELN